MSDAVEIMSGNPAWLPTPHTAMIEVLAEHDGPLIAVIEQFGARYLARCLAGEFSSAVSAWIYPHLDVYAERVLLEGENVEAAREVVERLSYGDQRVAIADENGTVQSFFDLYIPDHFKHALEMPLFVAGAALEHMQKRAEDLRVQIDEAEQARAELVRG